jgi:hypothetical protein
MGWLEDKAAKWAQLIDEHAVPGVSERVLEGREGLAEASPEGRAAWSRQAMERLAEAVADAATREGGGGGVLVGGGGGGPPPATREKIMEGRACVFVDEFGEEPLLELRKIYQETGGVDAVFEAMARDREKHSRPYREGDVVVEVKAPRDAEAFAAAQTLEERRVAYCHCPLARAGAASSPAPEPYCCCGGGWYKGIWEFIVERPVRVEVLRSVMRGDNDCAFAVHLPRGVAG